MLAPGEEEGADPRVWHVLVGVIDSPATLDPGMSGSKSSDLKKKKLLVCEHSKHYSIESISGRKVKQF